MKKEHVAITSAQNNNLPSSAASTRSSFGDGRSSPSGGRFHQGDSPPPPQTRSVSSGPTLLMGLRNSISVEKAPQRSSQCSHPQEGGVEPLTFNKVGTAAAASASDVASAQPVLPHSKAWNGDLSPPCLVIDSTAVNAAACSGTVVAMEDQAFNPAKLFVGGLGQQSTEASLSAYFSRFGVVRDAVVIADRHSGRSRGFGFVVFNSHDAVEQCLNCRHNVDGVSCEVRRAVPRDEARGSLPYDSVDLPGKVYVGGLPETITEAKVRDHFGRFGCIRHVTLMYDKLSHRPRGFGFIVFENYKDAQASWGQHPQLGRTVEAKKAEPRPELRRMAGGRHSTPPDCGPRERSRGSFSQPMSHPSSREASLHGGHASGHFLDNWAGGESQLPPLNQMQYAYDGNPHGYSSSRPREHNTSTQRIVHSSQGDPYGYGALAAGEVYQSQAPPPFQSTNGCTIIQQPRSRGPYSTSDPYLAGSYYHQQANGAFGYETGKSSRTSGHQQPSSRDISSYNNGRPGYDPAPKTFGHGNARGVNHGRSAPY